MVYYELIDQPLIDVSTFQDVEPPKKNHEFEEKMARVHENFPFTSI